MFVGHTNPKICRSEKAVVLNLCKINEPRKQKLKVEILHDLKEFLKFNLLKIILKEHLAFVESCF